MVVGLRARVETFSVQTTQYIVDEVDLLRCVKLQYGRMTSDFSLSSRNRGEPSSFISVRVKVQPTNITC